MQERQLGIGVRNFAQSLNNAIHNTAWQVEDGYRRLGQTVREATGLKLTSAADGSVNGIQIKVQGGWKSVKSLLLSYPYEIDELVDTGGFPCPTVIFDESLKEPPYKAEFDTRAYAILLKGLGVPESEIKNMTIHIKRFPSLVNIPLPLFEGTYIPAEKKVIINSDAFLGPTHALLHETVHIADYAKNPERFERTAMVSPTLCVALHLVGWPLAVAGIMGLLPEETGVNGALLALLGTVWYSLSYVERRAIIGEIKFARDPRFQSIITISKETPEEKR